MAKPTIALLYDFDKTLSIKDQQEYTFIPSLGMEASEFWGEADKISKENNMDRILSYMFLMIKQARKKNVEITKEAFKALGADVDLLPGVKTWFKRINEYGKSKGVKIEHYIISSGLKEIMEGTPIAKHFKRIYGCEFHYNTNGNADWPAQVVNYTTKTQFIFRISKGALDLYDDSLVNSYMPMHSRSVPYSNMIYIGDGLTDVPCMKLIRDRGGESIALFHGKNKSLSQKLLLEKRVGFICPANYSKNSELEITVKTIIDKMKIAEDLEREHEKQYEEAKNSTKEN
jgi:2-hydroxy-3-keto-5-methylthiopentenyl-1-phosphate phosphatase